MYQPNVLAAAVKKGRKGRKAKVEEREELKVWEE